MPDIVGFRAKWGVIIPSTGTVVEHDFNLLAPYGITCHAGRAYIGDPGMHSDTAAAALLDQMDESFSTAVRDVMTTEPDHLIIAMSAEIMRRGVKGAAAFIADCEAQCQLPVTAAPDACVAALHEMGAERIALVTPYHSQSNQLTRAYFEEVGFEVLAIKGLEPTSATDIARISPQRIIDAFKAVDSDRVDVLVQVGTNLSTVAVAAEAERWLGKPTVAMNTATVWHTLRRSGFTDRIAGFGSLLLEH